MKTEFYLIQQSKLQMFHLMFSEEAQKKFWCKLVQIILEPKAQQPAGRLPMRKHLGRCRPTFIRLSSGHKSANPVVIPPSAGSSWMLVSRRAKEEQPERLPTVLLQSSNLVNISPSFSCTVLVPNHNNQTTPGKYPHFRKHTDHNRWYAIYMQT